MKHFYNHARELLAPGGYGKRFSSMRLKMWCYILYSRIVSTDDGEGKEGDEDPLYVTHSVF